MLMGDVPFNNEIEIVRAELNFTEDISEGMGIEDTSHEGREEQAITKKKKEGLKFEQKKIFPYLTFNFNFDPLYGT